ncbi:hypothetical protein [Ectopseudomonas mendocina]|uniref:hypothetical protein n=1 Tax=Ectopseudomonas mendocina TaxID=300 RepID=UPI000693E2C1|nr:hypothetical protein [Pseudomonas mendocina]VEE17587.1 Uncharacterised protein [Pseudomonas mendocina]
MQRHINHWQTALSATLPVGAEQMTVPAAAAGLLTLTDGAWYKATITNAARSAWEIVMVTARAGGVLNIARAQEGTNAAEWPAGSVAFIELTAGALHDIASRFAALEARVAALEAGGGPDPEPEPDGALVDGAGNVLVDQQGNTLVMGAADTDPEPVPNGALTDGAGNTLVDHANNLLVTG